MWELNEEKGNLWALIRPWHLWGAPDMSWWFHHDLDTMRAAAAAVKEHIFQN